MTHDIFISYSSKDKPVADAICAHLEAAGIRCWIAPRDIIPGEDWPTAITRAISHARVLVLVFSAHSNASEDVSRELFLAANQKLVLIPFKIENVEPEPGKQYYLARTHWLDALNPPTQEQIQNLVERVKTLTPLKAPEVPAGQASPGSALAPAPPEGKGKPTLGKRRIPTWAFLALLGLILVGLLGWGAFGLMKQFAATGQPTPTPSLTATLPVAASPTVPPTELPQPTTENPTGAASPVFDQVYVSDSFNDNSLIWPIGNSNGPDWQGTLAITDGVLDWQGASLGRMNALLHPGKADLQDDLTDQLVSVRIDVPSQDTKGVYGLYLRGSGDGNNFYAFYEYDGQYIFYVMHAGNWKNLINFETSNAASGEGWVKIAVEAVGSHFRLFVDDELLTELDDATLASGQSGLILTAYAADKQIMAQYDDFTILLPAP